MLFSNRLQRGPKYGKGEFLNIKREKNNNDGFGNERISGKRDTLKQVEGTPMRRSFFDIVNTSQSLMEKVSRKIIFGRYLYLCRKLVW